MPWSNQNGGGSGGGGWKGGGGPGGPWGQGGGQPPDLEDILKRGQDRLKQVMPGPGLPGPLALLLASLAVAVIAFYAFTFQVAPDELGVVLRFGQFTRQEPPGLHFRLPYPVEEVRLPKVTKQNVTTLGKDGNEHTCPGASASLMLTGDENIVDLSFSVLWVIRTDQVQDYLFNIQNPEVTVCEVAQSAMREVVGRSDLQPLLTQGRERTEDAVQKLIQDKLDLYRAGVQIVRVQLKEVDPPSQVIDTFRDVQAAVADRERMKKEAQTYADQIVPRARGEAERVLQTAQGYRDRSIAEAQGQAGRFLKILDEYKKAPDVTRQRMFLEMQEKVLSGTDKIILDSKSGQGIVPYLPLGDIQGSRKPEGGK